MYNGCTGVCELQQLYISMITRVPMRQSVLGTLRDSRSSERSLRGRRLDLQLGHGTQIERYPAKSQNSEYLSIACMKTYDL